MERKYSLLKRGGKAAAGGVVLGLALLLSVLGFHGGLLPANAVPEEGCELPIIMYHGLLKEEARQGKYVLSPAQFESDLKYLKENGYHTVVVQDLIDYVEKGVPLPEKPVMLTFDDGYYNNYYYAFPLLEEYDAKIVISPICRYTDEYSLAAVFYRMVCGQAPVPAAQRIVADSNPRAKSVNGSLPLYVSQVLQLGLRLRPMERIQTVPQLYQALSSKEYTAELTRTMKPETPVRTAPPEPERKEHLLSLKALLAGIVILLSILILLTLWSVLSQHIHQPAASAAESEPASSEVMVPQNLVPNFIGMDYTQVQNNREYTSMYLFYVTEEYSDTAPAGQIIQQEPSADTVLKAGETIRLVVSKGPQMAEMPNIIGFTQDSAVKELEARGLVASCYMVVNDGSYATGCVVSASEEEGAMVTVGTVITIYIAADPSVQITAPPEEPAATEPTTPETPPEGGTEPEYDTD